MIELESKIGEFGRGERDSASVTQQTVRLLLVNKTPLRERAERTA